MQTEVSMDTTLLPPVDGRQSPMARDIARGACRLLVQHGVVCVPELVLEGVLMPLWAAIRRALAPLRAVQHGRLQQYLVYVFLTLCILLASLFSVGDVLAGFLRW